MYIRKLKQQVICDYDKAIVSTKAGRLRGVISEGTYVFRGVQYAQAERFQMPRPVTPWEGVREAIVYGFACPELFTPVPHDQYTVPHYFCVQSEDCQYLNVWTQSLDTSAKRPVMVWLHGGGFFSGSGVEHYAYDGENLSKYGDVVVVTLNHRLNVLGFLDLAKYGEEYKHSGNAGMADIVAALKWIRDNIAQFGGDPDNVMIFGQSGGGGKVVTLLQMPAADGLYRRAAMQSGGMGRRPEVSREVTARAAEYVMEYLHITDVRALAEVEYDELGEAANYATQKLREEGTPMMWSPVADGEYYMGNPLMAGFRAETSHIPVLCGTVMGEFSNNFSSPRGVGSKNQWSDSYKAEMLAAEFGADAEKFAAEFARAYPDKNAADLLFLDRSGRKSAIEFAKRRAEVSSAGTYSYIFTLESPFNGGTLAWHNAEIPYAFHNAEYLEPSFIPGVTEGLQDVMSSAWSNFARGGDPNGGPVPAWPACTPQTVNTMIFDREVRLGVNHDAALMAMLPDAKFNISGLIGKKK